MPIIFLCRFFLGAYVADMEQTNCLHEFFPEVALARAKYLDDYFAEHKKPIGPLHGLPISLKDQLRIKVSQSVFAYWSQMNCH